MAMRKARLQPDFPKFLKCDQMVLIKTKFTFICCSVEAHNVCMNKKTLKMRRFSIEPCDCCVALDLGRMKNTEGSAPASDTMSYTLNAIGRLENGEACKDPSLRDTSKVARIVRYKVITLPWRERVFLSSQMRKRSSLSTLVTTGGYSSNSQHLKQSSAAELSVLAVMSPILPSSKMSFPSSKLLRTSQQILAQSADTGSLSNN